MEKELNIAEILKDKPKGLKLWSDTFGELIVDCIDEQNDAFPIYLKVRHGNNICLTKDGCYYSDEAGTLPCIVPSKSMRDWSKLAWKKGDVLEYTEGEEPYYAIFEAFQDNEYTAFKSRYNFGGGNHWLQFNSQSSTNHFTKVSDEEAKAFIEKVEEHYGGKLNLDTLKIVKPQFKDGDIVVLDEIQRECYAKCILAIKNIEDGKIDYYAFINLFNNDVLLNGTCFDKREPRSATDEEKQQLFTTLAKEGKRWNAETKTLVDLPKKCEFKPMDWCLMSDCFDDSLWNLCQFAFKDNDGFYHSVNGGIWRDCIPYNDQTAHLLGTTDDYEEGGE